MTITLVVEDGTGTVADANTYVSSADATTYWANRANATWAAASADAQAAALIQATQYLDARYSYKGVPLLTTQPLVWPRQPRQYIPPVLLGYQVPVYVDDPDEDAIFTWPPSRLVAACCEAALRALGGSLYTDVGTSVVTSEKVDVIQVNYAPRIVNGGQIRIAIVDDLLKPLLISGRYNIALARA